MTGVNIEWEGQPASINFISDIVELKQTEDALRESEKRYRLLIETAREGILVVQNDILKFVNPMILEMTGHTEKELMSLPFSEFIHHDDRELVRNIHLKRKKGETVYPRYQFRLLRNDKSIKWVEMTGVNIEWEGHPASINFVSDITDRKQTEETLRESEKRYRLLIETAREGILVAQNGFLKFVNPMILELSGRTEKELMSLPLLEFVFHDDRELVGNNHLKRMKGEMVDPRYQFRFLRNDKSIRWVEMTGVNIAWEGQPASINFVSDITERKQAEAEIKLKDEELLKLNVEKDKFFSIIAHDLRGPFCGFLALIQMMAEDLPSLTMAKIQEIVVDLRNSASNLFHLLENLLHWARMQQGLIPIDLKVMDLFPIVNECITLVTEPAKAKGIEIICDIPHDLTVYADSNILQMVFRNLLSNAVKFTNKGGKVNLTAKINDNKSIEISIKDSGIGMSRQMVDQLFRLDVKTNRVGTEGEPSTGLGLMLCKEFIEKHGGKLWVESEEGKGSIFYFTLPCKMEMKIIG
jgi:PAS domain S-box-containing protein